MGNGNGRALLLFRVKSNQPTQPSSFLSWFAAIRTKFPSIQKRVSSSSGPDSLSHELELELELVLCNRSHGTAR